MKNFLIEEFVRYYPGDEIYKNQNNRAYHTCGGRGFVGKPEEKGNLVNLSIDGIGIMRKWFLKAKKKAECGLDQTASG